MTPEDEVKHAATKKRKEDSLNLAWIYLDALAAIDKKDHKTQDDERNKCNVIRSCARHIATAAEICFDLYHYYREEGDLSKLNGLIQKLNQQTANKARFYLDESNHELKDFYVKFCKDLTAYADKANTAIKNAMEGSEKFGVVVNRDFINAERKKLSGLEKKSLENYMKLTDQTTPEISKNFLGKEQKRLQDEIKKQLKIIYAIDPSKTPEPPKIKAARIAPLPPDGLVLSTRKGMLTELEAAELEGSEVPKKSAQQEYEEATRIIAELDEQSGRAETHAEWKREIKALQRELEVKGGKQELCVEDEFLDEEERRHNELGAELIARHEAGLEYKKRKEFEKYVKAVAAEEKERENQAQSDQEKPDSDASSAESSAGYSDRSEVDSVSSGGRKKKPYKPDEHKAQAKGIHSRLYSQATVASKTRSKSPGSPAEQQAHQWHVEGRPSTSGGPPINRKPSVNQEPISAAHTKPRPKPLVPPRPKNR